ncbi:MAG: diacylglycerol kinase family protein [bacterium]
MKHFFFRRLHSFKCAGDGVVDLFKTQPNAQVHLVGILTVIACGLWLQLDRRDWALLVLAMALVLAAEAMNTAIEVLCDLLHPDQHPAVKRIKDVAAASVLLCALSAAVVGGLVLVPLIIQKVSG